MALINFFYASNALLVSPRAPVIWKLDTCFHQGIITYLLLTEFEVCIASYEPSFSTWPITARVLFICRVNPRRSGIYFLPTVQDFAYISDKLPEVCPRFSPIFRRERNDDRKCVCCSQAIPDSPEIEFGGKWIVRQKLKLVHKCVIGGLEPSNLEDW